MVRTAAAGDVLGNPLTAQVGAFFVGPGKCGTSWVFETCRAHPDVNVGLIKEPGAFLEPEVDLTAYHALWDGPGVRCDFSNTYFFSDTAAEGVRRYNPGARICITVRNPVSRLVSQYVFMCRNGRFSGPIDAAIAAHPEIVDRCRYGRHAGRWLARFPAEQLLVLRLETLQADPLRYRRALFRHLGVPDREVASAASDRPQSAAAPRSRRLALAAKELAVLARRARLYRMIDRAKRSPLIGLLYRPLPATYQREHLAAIPPAVARELDDDYAGFVESISRARNVQLV
jgi:Sulfotransferase family